MKAETRNCQNCKSDFTIEPDDFGFYEKINVPPPTFCPNCRRQRRWAWRNNISLHSGKCELCKKSVVSIYNPNSGIKTFCNKCWWSDNWDPVSLGRDYDFSKPFFEQFKDLLYSVPHMSIVNDDGIASVNCEYTHDWWFSKNCYMCFSGWHVENVMYSFFVLEGKYIMDCYSIRSPNEWIYECSTSNKCFNLKYSELTLACIDSQFLYDCRECHNSLMCVGVRNKKYFFKNQKYSKEEYEKILDSYRLDTFSGVEKARREFEEFKKTFFRKYAQNLQVTDCTGDLISHSKNTKDSFVIKNADNVRYSDFMGDNSALSRDCYDVTMTGGASLVYESVVGDHSQMNLFPVFSVKSMDIKYSQHCHNCKHIFGCVGLRNTSYAIFNKRYSKEEYEELLPKIIKQMNEVPYTDNQGNTYKYGEFYPIEISPFGYNETSAMQIIKLNKEQVTNLGFKWTDHLQLTTGKETLLPDDLPDSIRDLDESILKEILKCVNCARNYKIVQNELTFYQKMEIPIPRKCFNCRHSDRVNKQQPFKLWHRQCMCAKTNHIHGAGKCEVEFETSYAPDRPEMVYCEKCYQAEVY